MVGSSAVTHIVQAGEVMPYVAVTLEIPETVYRPGYPVVLDLDIPWHMPIPLFLQEALPAILRRKGLPVPELPEGHFWRLVRLGRMRPLPLLTHTFRGAGVWDGERLRLEAHALPWPPDRFYLEYVRVISSDRGSFVPERIYLAQQQITLGRHDLSRDRFVDVDLSLFPHGRRVSRRHAEIVFEEGHFVLRDLNSRHGTWVNGRPVTVQKAHRLHPGDRVSLGDRLHFVFRDAQRGSPLLTEEDRVRKETSS